MPRWVNTPMRYAEISKLVEAKNPEDYWTPDTVQWWQVRTSAFKTEQEARNWMFGRLEHADKQSYAHLFGINGPEANRLIADRMPLYRDRKGVHIGIKPKISRAKQPMIGTEEPDGSAPDVAWHDEDLQDSGGYVSEATILRDYVPQAHRGRVTVYPAYVPSDDIPREVCVEEEEDCDEDERASYDWDQFRFRGSPPPIKLLVKSSGQIEIVDGNHRLRWWRQQGYASIPAWVIDYRRVKPR